MVEQGFSSVLTGDSEATCQSSAFAVRNFLFLFEDDSISFAACWPPLYERMYTNLVSSAICWSCRVDILS